MSELSGSTRNARLIRMRFLLHQNASLEGRMNSEHSGNAAQKAEWIDVRQNKHKI